MLLCVVFCGAVDSVFATPPQSPNSFVYVLDETNLLATSSKGLIEGDLRAFHALKYGDVYVRLVNSLNGKPIKLAADEYIHSIILNENGSPKIALLLISIGDRQARIAVSPSMSPLVTDVSASGILLDNLLEPMSRGQIGVGIRNTVFALTDLIKERRDLELGSQDAVEVRGGDIATSLFSLASLLSFCFVVVSSWLVSRFTKGKLRNIELVVALVLGVIFSLVGGFGTVIGGLVFATPALVFVVYLCVRYARNWGVDK